MLQQKKGHFALATSFVFLLNCLLQIKMHIFLFVKKNNPEMLFR